MTNENEYSAMSEQQRAEWVREQYQKATKYLAEKGIVTESVAPESSRYLPPIVSVWKLRTINQDKVWVISGDVPCDHIHADSESNVRDALRNFSMKWQMQAEAIRQSAKDKSQLAFAAYLVSRAEGLYQLFENDKFWTETTV
ncbi:DUF4826 family protein [Thalassotalea ponticola]|uniref:DUF4826 family protein n=1 Tax=Thalassotalea ponticola TaxID=1523392 RepID=UPI0025B5B9E4|nr:DUF4826 family protein [Thalassotalea ponticola]MDN3651431.1 DUF4826 family protein [Thalassotalea ponticola]